MNIFERAVKVTLLHAIEDDTGLWQITLEMQAVVPEASLTSRQELARQVTEHLLDQNWVVGITSEKPWGECVIVDCDQFKAKLLDPLAWNEAWPNDQFWAIRVTEQGAAHYWKDLDGAA